MNRSLFLRGRTLLITFVFLVAALLGSFDISASTAALTAIWTQIANRFKSYSDYLIFETLNEPRVVGLGRGIFKI